MRREKPVLDWTKMMDIGAEIGLIEDQDVRLSMKFIAFWSIDAWRKKSIKIPKDLFPQFSSILF